MTNREVWEVLDAMRCHPQMSPHFLEGATDDEIEAAQEALGWKAPLDLRVVWRTTNGITLHDSSFYGVLSRRSPALFRKSLQTEIVRPNSHPAICQLADPVDRAAYVVIGYLADPARYLCLPRASGISTEEAERSSISRGGLTPTPFRDSIAGLLQAWYEAVTGLALFCDDREETPEFPS
jgi:hypothetical protein